MRMNTETPIYEQLVSKYRIAAAALRETERATALYDAIGPITIDYPDSGVPPFPRLAVRLNLARSLLSGFSAQLPVAMLSRSADELQAWSDGYQSAVTTLLLKMGPPDIVEKEETKIGGSFMVGRNATYGDSSKDYAYEYPYYV